MRLFLAILLCKLSRTALRILGRGGTALPGSLALKLCPDIVARLSRGVRTVMVTGTNGKTTTCRMIEQMLLDAKIDCMANRSGSNLERGIAADLCANASLTGRPKKRTAVIECDEAAFKRVCGEINPEVVVVTNIFRDQLDRYGEVTHTLGAIREGLDHAPHARVCLNADCSLTASLAPCAPDRVRFFGVDAPLSGSASLALVGDVIRTCGVDSRAARLCSVISGASETVFFTGSLYLGAAGVRRSRYAVPVALLAYLAGVLAAAWLV